MIGEWLYVTSNKKKDDFDEELMMNVKDVAKHDIGIFIAKGGILATKKNILGYRWVIASIKIDSMTLI
jgi:hypothetical protein